MKPALRILALLFSGTLLGLLLAEAVFWIRDDGAFPHVNFYMEDATFGVRLEPHASESLTVAGNPPTHLRTNSFGFRGEEWGESDGNEVLLIGDSQVFGLGVEEEETAAAVLGRELGVNVRNAGIPTYGPQEYLRLTERLVLARNPKTVVVVLNMANDWFELERPNRERHAVWDGWAVRTETAPAEITDFPGRRWLFSKSHLIFAIRDLFYGTPAFVRHDESEARKGLPSEGSVSDLVGISRRQREQLILQFQATAEQEQQMNASLQQQLRDHRDPVEALPDWVYALNSIDLIHNQEFLAFQAMGRNAHPGDIVQEPYGESSRSVPATAKLIREGAELRKKLPERFRAWLNTNPASEDRALVERLLQALTGRPSLTGTDVIVNAPPPISPFHSWLMELKAVCADRQLMIVALPLDLQVSPHEWEKYGDVPEDMSSTEYLLSELAADASYQQIRVLNALPLLRAAEPDVFLLGDIHMTAKGQEVLGKAMAATLRGPMPPRPPEPGLPEGRSRVPLPEEWTDGRSIRPGCQIFQVREWVQLECTNSKEFGTVAAMNVTEGPLEAMTGGEDGRVRVLSPLLPGQTLSVELIADDHRAFHFDIDGSDPFHPNATLLETLRPTPPLPLCPLPAGAAARFDLGCSTLDGCEAQLACATGRRTALPFCEAGSVNAGAAGWCFPLCNEQIPCKDGVCSDWQGTKVCL